MCGRPPRFHATSLAPWPVQAGLPRIMKRPHVGFWCCLARAVPLAFASSTFALQEPLDLRALRNPVPLGLPAATHLVAGDLDGDGDIDAYGFAPEGATLLRNDGRAWFESEPVPRAPFEPDTVALSDLDGDGDLDLYFGSVGDRLYLNDGNGQLTEVGGLPQVASRTRAIVLADFDADGDVDVFAGGDEDALFENDGTGVFTCVVLPPQAGVTMAATAIDYDGDGDLDLLRAGDVLERLENGGGFPMVAAGTIANTGIVHDILGADLDGDGIDELVLAATEPIWVNDGVGGFTPTGSGLPTFSQMVQVADLEGDGDLDLLLGNFRFEGYRNEGGLSFTDANLNVFLPAASSPADLDGDGDIDFLSGFGTPRLNDGSGHFGRSSSIFASIWTGDLDGDGLADALRPVGEALFAFGTGGGHVRTMPWAPNESIRSPFDADGDGDLDVLAKDQSGWLLWHNDGNANFSAGAFVPAPIPTHVLELAVVLDVNSDGIFDLLILDLIGDTQDEVHLGDGAGGFALAPGLLPVPTLSANAITADADGDGDGDLFLTGREAKLFTWNGSSFDDASSNLPPDASGIVGLLADDWDGDGDVDLYGSRGILGGEPCTLLTNDGTGVFVATNFPPAGPTAVSFDFDQDGDPDIVHAKVWLQNDGAGQFTRREYRAGSPFGGPSIGDYDGDGDVDLYDTEWGLLNNVERQLARASHSRVGGDLVLDVYDTPGSLWILAMSLATARVELPVLGTLYLHPASLRIVDQGVLDAEGRASAIFPVPADATLIGKTLYWQGLSGTPLRFTSHERTTLSNL